ncbi:hypothetical protein V5O48_012609 [Marasmius crinis-equi]|uniref:F-box domain-containing protein n=1 Tax=Marasmius crinis-equi TaxID=585013 RepID=A0ABR3F2B4_9AGAR
MDEQQLPPNTLFPSPFSHVLHTNYFPSKQEAQMMDSLLQEPQQRLDDLNAHITRLEETLERVRGERDTLRTHIEDHRALLSPFRRFPEDVLREIFAWCLNPYPIRSAAHAPLLLTTICRYWREIALTTPRLWSSIHIFIPQFRNVQRFEELISQRIAGVDRWLRHSGDMPLTLSIAFDLAMPTFTYDIAQAMLRTGQLVMDTFFRYRTQWKDVTLHGVLPAFLASATGLKLNEMPRLTTLSITGSVAPGIQTKYDDTSLDSLIQASPSLQKFHFTFESHDVLTLPLRWEQMTEISLRSRRGSVGAQSGLTALSHMSQNLRKCCLWILSTAMEADKQIHLPSLQSLEIFFQDTRSAGNVVQVGHFETIKAFLGALTCPSLEHLLVDGEAAVTESPFVPFLEQSGFNLKSFSTCLPLNGEALVDCLRMMSGLTTLNLRRGVFWGTQQDTQAAIRAMTPFECDNPIDMLCPALEDLTFMDMHPIDAEIVMDLLSRRARGFKYVKAIFNNAPKTGVEEWQGYRSRLNDLRRGGLSVVWRFSKPKDAFDRPVNDSPNSGHPLVMVSMNDPGHPEYRQMEAY